MLSSEFQSYQLSFKIKKAFLGFDKYSSFQLDDFSYNFVHNKFYMIYKATEWLNN